VAPLEAIRAVGHDNPFGFARESGVLTIASCRSALTQ